MKRQIHFLKNTALIIAVIFLGHLSSTAATFTATTSGNWSAGATWGGTAPSFILTTDQVVIPGGITVTMDNSVNVTGVTASLAVQGTLNSGTTQSLTVGALGTVTGGGTINIGGISLQTASVLSFSGHVTVDTFTTALASLQLGAALTVNELLNLSSGALTITGGSSNLTMGSGSTIVLAGGSLANSGGSLSLTASYNVIYSASGTTGLELSGMGLNNVTVNVSNGNNLTLSSPLTVGGTLSLTSGNLVLNGNNLALNGTIATSGNGVITSTSVSSITLHTSGNTNGTLNFTGGSSIDNLTVNVGSNNTLSLSGSNLAVSGTLALNSGNINIGGDTLSLGVGGSVTGGSSSSYVIASGAGAFGMQLTAGASNSTVFPVGTSLNFSPAALQLAAGSTSGTVYVTVDTGVWAQGTSGVDLSLTQPMVNTTWMIEPSFSGNVNMNIELMWSGNMQVNGFTFDSAYVSHFINGGWNTSTVSSATLGANSMYQLELSGVTSFSPFAVFGKNAVVAGINEITNDAGFELYPNPVCNNLTLQVAGLNNVYAEIINVTGQVIARYQLNSSTTNIPLNGLSAGNYVVRLYNENMSAVQKFIKL